MKLIHEALTYQLRGIFYHAYNALGPGFDEHLYRDLCFEECLNAGIEVKKEHGISVIYKGHEIATFRLDLFVDNKVIVEFKAVDGIAPVHQAQLIGYLRATAMTIGLLVNFSPESVEIKRLANFPQAIKNVQVQNYYAGNESQRTDVKATDSPDEVVFQVIRGICDVWNELSYGYQESVYYRALELELGVETFFFDIEKEFDVFIDGQLLGKQPLTSVLNDDILVVLTSTSKPRNGLTRRMRSILNKTPLKCAILANLSGNQPEIQVMERETN